MTNTETLVEKNATAIREALRNNCLYVWHIWGDGMSARICDVRRKGGCYLQVRHLQQGTWHTVLADSRLVQR